MTLRPVISSRQVPSKRQGDTPWYRLVLECGHVTYRKYLKPTAGCVVCGRMRMCGKKGVAAAATPATTASSGALTGADLQTGD
jgi:hypothetical protein